MISVLQEMYDSYYFSLSSPIRQVVNCHYAGKRTILPLFIIAPERRSGYTRFTGQARPPARRMNAQQGSVP
jgi:hypothetical protein